MFGRHPDLVDRTAGKSKEQLDKEDREYWKRVEMEKVENEARLKRFEEAQNYCEKTAELFDGLNGLEFPYASNKDIANMYRTLGRYLDERPDYNRHYQINRELTTKFSVFGFPRVIYNDVESTLGAGTTFHEQVSQYIEDQRQKLAAQKEISLGAEREKICKALGITSGDLAKLRGGA